MFADFVSGQLLTAAALNASFDKFVPLRARKTVDETLSSVAAVQNDDHLFLSVAANTDYRLWLMGVFTTAASATPDLRSGFTMPAGATFTGNVYGLDTAATTGVSSTSYAGFLTATSGFNTPRGLVTGSNLVFLWEGIVRVGGTAGTMQFQWSQNVSTAETTACKAGSEFWLTRLP